MTNDRSILVALDGADRNEHLLRYAAMVATLNRRADRLEETAEPEVWGGSALSTPGGCPSDASSSPVLVDQGHRVLLTAPRALDLVRSPDADEILRAAARKETDVTLVGDRRLARRLVREAASSVWLVPGDPPLQVRRILVPVDFSNRAADSLRVATGLGRLAGAECRTIHVYFNNTLVESPGQDQRLHQKLGEVCARFLAGIDTLGVPVSGMLREGASVGRAIAHAAEEADVDLIVLASRGRTVAGALVLESVAAETLNETRVPLLVIKHFGARLGFFRALFEKVRRRDELHFN